MRELGVICRACFCTFYTSEMNTHSYMPFLFSINVLCHLYNQGRSHAGISGVGSLRTKSEQYTVILEIFSVM